MLKAAFIGAGGRAQYAHYPCVHRLEGVRIEAVAELDEEKMQTVARQYAIDRCFTDYRDMLASVDPDVIYCIMEEQYVTPIAIDCMNAGKHVAIEKPAGADVRATEQLRDAAVANGVHCLVAYQRRYGAVTREAMRLVHAQGPATLAIGEFHKPGDSDADQLNSLWNDVCHVADLVRYMVGSEVEEVTAYQDAQVNGAKNVFNGMIRFANRAVGIVSGNRCSGGRVLRSELHGSGVGCYMVQMPKQIEICESRKDPRIVMGWNLARVKEEDGLAYEGILAMHEHFIDCIRTGETPCSDIRDVIHTSRLVERLMGL